jgi:DNA-binding response OmpR family regulator
VYQTVRFLVVDDNAAVRMIIKEILRGFGAAHVDWANDGAAALQRLKVQPFDFLVTDRVMPGVDGVQLSKAVRSGGTQAKADIPIIMLSGNMDRASLVAARNAGVSEFAAKPVVIAHLHARIEACLRRPRPFIVSEGYTGPCRRRNAADFPFGERRGRKSARKQG